MVAETQIKIETILRSEEKRETVNYICSFEKGLNGSWAAPEKGELVGVKAANWSFVTKTVTFRVGLSSFF